MSDEYREYKLYATLAVRKDEDILEFARYVLFSKGADVDWRLEEITHQKVSPLTVDNPSLDVLD